MSETYWTKRKLLKKGKNEPDAIENEFLFGLEYWLLRGLNNIYGEPNASEMFYRLDAFMDELCGSSEDEYYPNHPDPKVLKHNPHISHDQLTAYSVYSVIGGRDDHTRIWKGIRFWFYNGRFIHPRDWVFYGLINHSICAYILSPIFVLTLCASFLRRYTNRTKKVDVKKNKYGQIYLEVFVRRRFIKDSNEMLFWNRFQALKISNPTIYKILKPLARKLCNYKFGSCRRMFENYFNYDYNHPMLTDFKEYKW